ncbi:hypothetical protein DAPPUDRAFT_242914 [Daphnia pulex]|uniref:Uncharacterized protein n=1 Tax=Daphnia pulex TaxID=6669 RepID=E9GHM8_DAPPU|nr:hypothetical protein DAPPUDRAFT_242914 [Daphnia pulex]|eukprot:EFX81027.1 hypothetical protein DAPPUDRAFT_242914 [Daphnia pulex]
MREVFSLLAVDIRRTQQHCAAECIRQDSPDEGHRVPRNRDVILVECVLLNCLEIVLPLTRGVR